MKDLSLFLNKYTTVNPEAIDYSFSKINLDPYSILDLFSNSFNYRMLELNIDEIADIWAKNSKGMTALDLTNSTLQEFVYSTYRQILALGIEESRYFKLGSFSWDKKIHNVCGFISSHLSMYKPSLTLQRHGITNSAIVKISRDFNWKPGRFGDKGSCFFGENAAARLYILPNLSASVLKFYGPDKQPVGRCWIVPINNNRLVIFNSYPTGQDLYLYGSLLADMLQTNNKIIKLTANGETTNTLYINGGRGIMLGDDIDTFNNVNIEYKEISMPVNYCYFCDEPFADDDINYISITRGTIRQTTANYYVCDDCVEEELVYCGTYYIKDENPNILDEKRC